MIKIARYLVSIDYVVWSILFFQGMLVIGTGYVLYTSFPVSMNDTLRLVSCSMGSISIEGFLLMVSVNMYLLSPTYGKKGIPLIFGLFSMIMTLFLLEAFTTDDPIVTCKRVFMSLEFGLINYLLSEVFVKKWEEHVKNEQLSTEMEMLKLVVDQQNSDLEGQQKEAQDLLRQIDELQTGSYADAREMERLRAEIEALKEELKIKETKLTRKKERVNIGQ